MPEPEQISDRRSLRQLIGLVAGPVCFAALAVSPPPSGLSEPGWAVAALAVWMAVWWATEAVPLFVTALLPLVLLPLFGVLDVRQAATPFGHPVVFLMLGGFLIGLALERWNLHRRIALHTIMCFGGRPTNLVAGKMLATAFLSMWITNTATTIMVLPIAISLIGAVVPDGKAGSREATNFATAMVLGIAYAASIGGMGSLVGSPTNLLAASYLDQTFGIELTFAGWMAVALPIAVVLLGLAYLVLTRIAFPISNSLGEAKTDVAGEMLREMGPMSVPERRVAIIFAVVAAAWIFRPLVHDWLGAGLTDTGIAIAGAIALFVVPANWRERTFLLGRMAVRKVPWEVLILFGGGLSLAKAIEVSQLATWMGNGLSFLHSMPLVVLVFGVALLVALLTEWMSNAATAAAFLPIAGSLALGSDIAPLLIVFPIALAASSAYMLPVATPPNTLVFGTGYVTIPQVVRAGALLTFLGAAIIAAGVTLLAPVFW